MENTDFLRPMVQKVDEVKSKLKFRNPNFSWQEAVGSRTHMIKWPRLAKMIKDEKMHEQPPNVTTCTSDTILSTIFSI
jgi:hypothetical protein